MSEETKKETLAPITKAMMPVTETGIVSSTILPPRPSENIAPRWMTFRPLAGIDGLNKALKSAHKGLKKVTSILTAAKNAIAAAKAIVTLLAIFEMFLKNALFAFLNTILDQAQRALNDAKSTGIYMLDMTSYHWQNKAEKIVAYDQEYFDAIKNYWAAKNQSENNDILLDEDQGYEDSEAIFNNWDDAVQTLAEIGKRYKKETYNQFINVACQAFNDVNDTPDGSLAYALYDKVLGNVSLDAKDAKLTPSVGLGGDAMVSLPKFMQSGRPNFGDTATMKVVFVVFAFPRVEEAIFLSTTIQKLVFKNATIGSAGEAVKSIWGTIKKTLDKNKQNEKEGSGRDFTNYLREGLINASKVPGKVVDGVMSSVTVDANEFPSWPAQKTATARGKEPNFIGINAYTLAAPLFDAIESLIIWLRSLSYNINTSLLKTILDMLSGIEREIDNLIKIVEMIDQFISMIEAILSIVGIRVLVFSTDKGNAGVIQGLKSAKGFNEDAKQSDIDKTKVELRKSIETCITQLTAASETLGDADEARIISSKKASDISAKIFALSVDKSYFTAKGLVAPATYSPTVVQSEWEKYPTQASSLYRALAEVTAFGQQKVTEADAARTNVASLRSQLTDLQDALVAADPSATERRRRNKAVKDIAALKAASDAAVAALASCGLRQSKLQAIQAIVVSWMGYVHHQQLTEKQEQYASLTISYNNDIAELNTQIDTLLAGLGGIAGITTQIANKVEEKSRGLNGYIKNDIVISTGYITDLATLNAELVALDAQNANPDEPQPENYTTRRATLVSRIAAMEDERDAFVIACDNYVSDWTEAKTYVTSELVAGATLEEIRINALAQITILRNALTDENNILHAGSYAKIDHDYTDSITAHEEAIVLLDDEYGTMSSTKGTRYGEIATYGADPDSVLYYSPDHFPTDPPTTGWVVGYNTLFNNAINDIKPGYWALKARLTQIPIDRAVHVDGIENDKIAQAANLVSWNAYSANNIREQAQVWGIVTNTIIPDEILIRDYRADIVDIEAEKTSVTGALNTAIQNILDTGWNTYLKNTDTYYKKKYPSQIKNANGTVGWSDWSGNEIGYLMAAYGYIRKEPKVDVNGSIAVSSALSKIANDYIVLRMQSEAATSAYSEAVKVENELLEKANNKKALQKKWTPNQKMYYGGYLFCIGWPNYGAKDANGKPSYFNVSDYYKTFSGGVKAGTADATKGFEKQWKIITDLFGKEKK